MSKIVIEIMIKLTKIPNLIEKLNFLSVNSVFQSFLVKIKNKNMLDINTVMIQFPLTFLSTSKYVGIMLLSTKIENMVKLATKNNIIKERNVMRFLFKICRSISIVRCFFFLKKLSSKRNYMQLLHIYSEL